MKVVTRAWTVSQFPVLYDGLAYENDPSVGHQVPLSQGCVHPRSGACLEDEECEVQ